MKIHNFMVFLILLYTIGFGLFLHDRSQIDSNLSVKNPKISHIPQDKILVHPIPPPGEKFTTYKPMYTSKDGEYIADVQSPIPVKDRVINHTGTQCVWASLETLGRWCGEEKLTNPPVTERDICQSYSSPSVTADILYQLGVDFEQTYGNRLAGLDLIKKAMSEGRGCLFGTPGHCMVLVHYDENANVVKFIDNSDRTLKIQTMTVDEFKRRWDSWVLVIYPT